MLSYILTALQIAALLISGIVLWQIWHFLHLKDIPDDEPLGEVRGKYLTTRLNILKVCLVLEAIFSIIQCILRFLKI